MNREDAIKVLRTESIELGGSAPSVCRFWEALDVAIAALMEQEGKDIYVPTNADRIRSMTDDDLNELFHEIYNAGAEDAVAYEWGQRTNSFEWTMEWLQQPAEEDDHE